MRWRGPESNWRHHDFQSCALPPEQHRLRAKASVRGVFGSVLAIAATALVGTSISGNSEQRPEPIATAMPAAHFGTVQSGPFSKSGLRKRELPLGRGAPAWADRMYRQSIRILV